MLCEKCKKELKENAKFCHHCGAVVQPKVEEKTAVQAEPVSQAVPEMQDSSKRKLLWVIPAAVVLVIAIVAIIGLNRPGTDTQKDSAKSVTDTSQEKAASKKAASKEAASRATEESAAEEAGKAQEEQEAPEALQHQREEAVAAYEAFLRGERSALCVAQEGSILSGDSDRYFYEDVVEYSKQWWYNIDTELRADYFYLEVGEDQIPDMVLRVGEIEPNAKYYYNCDCYVFDYSDGELYLYYGFYDTYMHGSGKINSHGIIEEREGLQGVGDYSTIKMLGEDQVVETVHRYVDYCFESVQWVTPGLHSEAANDIIKKVAQNYTDPYQTDIDGYIEIREYDIDGNYYYVYELYGDRTEQLEVLLTMLELEGMVFTDEATVAQIIESRQREFGGSDVFEMDTPEWILWEGSE